VISHTICRGPALDGAAQLPGRCHHGDVMLGSGSVRRVGEPSRTVQEPPLCKNGSEPYGSLPKVEARGFEPRSENRSTTVSTCVSRRLRSPTTGQRAAHRRTSLLKFRPMPEGVTPDYPDIAIPAAPPRAGFNSGHEHNAYALRCERQFSVGDCVFSRVFIQGSRPGHATTASLSPSKPGRPRRRVER
jgi:hypothetical protein